MVLYLKEGKTDAVMSFGEKLLYFRKKNALSAHEIGKLVGVSAIAVKGFEKNIFKPWQPETYDILAEVFGCTAEELKNDSATLRIEMNKKEEKAMKKEPVSTEESVKNSDMKYGEKLHDLRTEKGLTLTQISDAIGIKKGAYSGMEYKNSRPTDVKVYDKLAEVLGCDVSYLTEGDERFSVQKDAPVEEPAPIKAELPSKSEQKPAPMTTENKPESAPINIEETQLPSDAPFGKKLSTLRKQKGLTLAHVADKIGVTLNTYKGMEYKNVRPADVKTYNKLAKVLGCDVGYLKEGDKRFEKKEPVEKKPEKKVIIIPTKKKVEKSEVPAEVPQPDSGEIEEDIPIEALAVPAEKSSASSEVIKLVSRLSVLLSGDEIGKDEKDAVMVALNGAYWR